MHAICTAKRPNSPYKHWNIWKNSKCTLLCRASCLCCPLNWECAVILLVVIINISFNQFINLWIFLFMNLWNHEFIIFPIYQSILVPIYQFAFFKFYDLLIILIFQFVTAVLCWHFFMQIGMDEWINSTEVTNVSLYQF